MIWPLLVTVFLFVVQAVQAATDKPYVKVAGQVGQAPCTVRVTVHYPEDRTYAYYVAIVDEGGPVTSSFKEHPPYTWTFHEFRDLPAGDYEIITRVARADGTVKDLNRQPIICKGDLP